VSNGCRLADGDFKERGGNGSSDMFTGLDALPSGLRFLKKTAVSKTSVARLHFSERPKLRRARRSLEDVTSNWLGEMRRTKMGNMAVLIAGITFPTKSSFA
jgi:hypothetical protein